MGGGVKFLVWYFLVLKFLEFLFGSLYGIFVFLAFNFFLPVWECYHCLLEHFRSHCFKLWYIIVISVFFHCQYLLIILSYRS